jgi:hypothetical protein
MFGKGSDPVVADGAFLTDTTLKWDQPAYIPERCPGKGLY